MLKEKQTEQWFDKEPKLFENLSFEENNLRRLIKELRQTHPDKYFKDAEIAEPIRTFFKKHGKGVSKDKFTAIITESWGASNDPITLSKLANQDPEAATRLFAASTGAPALDELPDISWGEVAKGINPLATPEGWNLGFLPTSNFWASGIKNAADIVKGFPQLPAVVAELSAEILKLVPSAAAGVGTAKATRLTALSELDTQNAATEFFGQSETDTQDIEDIEKLFADEAFISNFPILTAMARDYMQRYGSMKGFKYALANDPFSIILDAVDVIIPAAKAVGLAADGTKLAQIAKRTADTAEYFDPGKYMGDAVGYGLKKWTDHMKKNPSALSDVEIDFGVGSDGKPMKMKVNLRKLAEQYGGVENVPITALVTEDFPKHIEEGIKNLYDSKHPYHQAIIQRFEKSADALAVKRSELVGETGEINLHNPEEVGNFISKSYKSTRDGKSTPLGKKLNENQAILEQPIRTIKETAIAPKQIAEWDADPDVFYRVTDTGKVYDDFQSQVVAEANAIGDKIRDELEAEDWDIDDGDALDRFVEKAEEMGLEVDEDAVLELWQGSSPHGDYTDIFTYSGLNATRTLEELQNYTGRDPDYWKGFTGRESEQPIVVVLRSKEIGKTFTEDGAVIDPTGVEEIARYPASEILGDFAESGIIDGIFENTQAQVDKLVAKDSGTREHINNRQLREIVKEIDDLIAGTQGKLEQNGHLTIQDLKQFRTDFNQNMDVFRNKGEIIAKGEGSPITLLAYALKDDFYNLLEAEVLANPADFPDNFDAVVKLDGMEYAKLIELENTAVGKYLRNLAGESGKDFRIVTDLLAAEGIFNTKNIDILKQSIGSEGWETLRKGALAEIFQRSTHLNKTDGALGLVNVLNKVNAKGRNRLHTIFGIEMTKDLYEMADFQNRVFGKDGKWNTPWINKIFNESQSITDMMFASSAISDTFADNIASLAKQTGMERYIQPSKIGPIVGMLAWMHKNQVQKAMFSEKGRQAILEGRNLTLPFSGGQIKITAREIALVINWMEKHDKKISEAFRVARVASRRTAQTRDKR